MSPSCKVTVTPELNQDSKLISRLQMNQSRFYKVARESIFTEYCSGKNSTTA